MVAPELAKVALAGASRLIVAKVSTEELPALAQRFGVRSIPMLATFLHGREVNRTAGARPTAAIQDCGRQAVGS
jgi:thioredoxin 2